MSFSLIEALTSLSTISLLMASLLPLVVQGIAHGHQQERQSQLMANGSRGMEILSSRIREACYIWPPDSPLQLGTSASTRNTLGSRPSSIWQQGTNFLALILPPPRPDQLPQLVAYYPMVRSHYLRTFSGSNALQPQPNTDNHSWVLLEYRRNLEISQASSCAQLPAVIQPASLAGGQARLFLDQMDPQTPWLELQTRPVRLSQGPEIPLNLVTAVVLTPGWLMSHNGIRYRLNARAGPVWVASLQQWWGGSTGQFRALLPP